MCHIHQCLILYSFTGYGDIAAGPTIRVPAPDNIDAAEDGSPARSKTQAPKWKAALRWLPRAVVLLTSAGCAVGYGPTYGGHARYIELFRGVQ